MREYDNEVLGSVPTLLDSDVTNAFNDELPIYSVVNVVLILLVDKNEERSDVITDDVDSVSSIEVVLPVKVDSVDVDSSEVVLPVKMDSVDVHSVEVDSVGSIEVVLPVKVDSVDVHSVEVDFDVDGVRVVSDELDWKEDKIVSGVEDEVVDGYSDWFVLKVEENGQREVETKTEPLFVVVSGLYPVVIGMVEQALFWHDVMVTTVVEISGMVTVVSIVSLDLTQDEDDGNDHNDEEDDDDDGEDNNDDNVDDGNDHNDDGDDDNDHNDDDGNDHDEDDDDGVRGQYVV